VITDKIPLAPNLGFYNEVILYPNTDALYGIRRRYNLANALVTVTTPTATITRITSVVDAILVLARRPPIRLTSITIKIKILSRSRYSTGSLLTS
jgi:hypothetical protein